ncbi:MAG: thermonuclease family protein [Candidatus Pacearchaeota archaeon]
MKKRKQSNLILIILLILIIIISVSAYFISKFDKYSDPDYIYFENDYVARVIDGDTFELSNGDIVRLICIDAPELNTDAGKQSQEFLESLILYKEIDHGFVLTSDVDDKDAYGRLLRYAYIDENGANIFVNKEMVYQGYAEVFRYGNNTKLCDEIES